MTLQMPRIVRITFLVVAAVISSVATTEACLCAHGELSAACEVYPKADVAFVGRAIEVPPDRAAGPVRFRLTYALKGVAGPEVSVLNEESGMGCGYPFTQGEDYVVFARRTLDGDVAITCSSGIWMVRVPEFAYPAFRRRAAEAAAFTASLLRPATGGRIFGEVSVRVPFSGPDDDPTKPVDGATVILRSPGKERRATSVEGRYEFTGLARGTYSISVMMPADFPPARSARSAEHLGSQAGSPEFGVEPEFTRTISITDARACGYAPFETEFDGEIAGTVVRDDGAPVTGLRVHVFPATIDPQRQEFSSPSVETDPLGAYRISKLPPGRYTVAINPRDEALDSMPFPTTFHREHGSNEPSVIELGDGTHVEVGALRLPPPMARRQIAGTITWGDGRRLSDVRVDVCEDRSGRLGEYCRRSAVSAEGRFSVTMFAGRTYNVRAEAADPRGRWDKATDQAIPPIGTAGITLTLDSEVNLRLVLVPRHEP